MKITKDTTDDEIIYETTIEFATGILGILGCLAVPAAIVAVISRELGFLALDALFATAPLAAYIYARWRLSRSAKK